MYNLQFTKYNLLERKDAETQSFFIQSSKSKVLSSKFKVLSSKLWPKVPKVLKDLKDPNDLTDVNFARSGFES